MSNFEVGPCTFEEYLRYRGRRVAIEELTIDGLYWAMFCAGEPGIRQATRFPSRIINTEIQTTGLHVVRYSMLDPDLKKRKGSPDALEGHFKDDLWQPSSPTKLMISQHDHVQEGYFVDYGVQGDVVENVLQAIVSRHTAMTTRGS